MLRKHEIEKAEKIMDSRNNQTGFLQERLQVFLHRLLTMEADFIVQWWTAFADSAHHGQISFGFAHPLPG